MKGMFANVIAASQHSQKDVRPIITIHCRYPRFIHTELLTHRGFSRNARSSRAVPIHKIIEEIENNPVIPWHWGKNQPGMQADEECDEMVNHGEILSSRSAAWLHACHEAVVVAKGFMKAGYHKQVVNRLLEPFMRIDTLVTSTEWDNFFELRCHKDAEPHFQDLANMMKAAIKNATYQKLEIGDWHLPYVTAEEACAYDTDTLLKISAARCARVSYAPFDGNSDIERETQRFDKLINAKPMHASPVEHQANAVSTTIRFDDLEPDDEIPFGYCGNFDAGWHQFRKLLEK